MTVADLPVLNACLNGTSALLLALGFISIRRKRVAAHRNLMLGAFVVSVLFLVSYLTYHFQAGSKPFGGSGWIRPVYFAILVSHTVLAVAIVPLVVVTLLHGLKRRHPAHERIARWTLPLWFYVSVTGVAIYFMLYQLYPSPGTSP